MIQKHWFNQYLWNFKQLSSKTALKHKISFKTQLISNFRLSTQTLGGKAVISQNLNFLAFILNSRLIVWPRLLCRLQLRLNLSEIKVKKLSLEIKIKAKKFKFCETTAFHHIDLNLS
jgi:hypothetical protein